MADFETFTTRVDAQGRVLIPVRLRKAAGIRPDTDVLMFIEDGALIVATRERALAQARALIRKHVPAGVSLADELVAERRQEAARETEDARGRKSA